MRPSLLIAGLCAAAVAFLAPSTVQADCGIGGISLQSIADQDFTATNAGAPQTTWRLRPCGPTPDKLCQTAGPLTSACVEDDDGSSASSYGYWTQDLWHKWSFMDPNNPAAGIQLYMEGSASAAHCNELGLQTSWTFFPCAKEQGPLSVTLGLDCTANFTLPTPLTCREPLEGTQLALE